MIRPKFRRPIQALTLLLATCAASAATLAADDLKHEPSAEQGLKLAEKLCQNCHVIQETAETTVPAGVPTFRVIANKPGQTGEHIKAILVKPHAPMPDMQLTNDEIADLLAYIDTLRDSDAVPHLSPSPTPEKPPVPDHG